MPLESPSQRMASGTTGCFRRRENSSGAFPPPTIASDTLSCAESMTRGGRAWNWLEWEMRGRGKVGHHSSSDPPGDGLHPSPLHGPPLFLDFISLTTSPNRFQSAF